jgi:hypothetical protein
MFFRNRVVRRYLRYWLVLLLALDVVALVLIFPATVGTHLSARLVEIRNAVFSKFVSQRSALEVPLEFRNANLLSSLDWFQTQPT